MGIYNEIRNLLLVLNQSSSLSVIHIRRDANYFADSLAKVGVHRVVDFVAWL